MKKLAGLLTSLLLTFLLSTSLIGQGTITGKLLEPTGEGVIGANIIVVDTEIGAVSQLDGSFEIMDVPLGQQTILVSYVGFRDMEIPVNVVSGINALGDIALESSAIGLDEITVTADVAIDRRTPVAVSTISSVEIEEKLGNQEFPEIMKNTPSVFATKDRGGYGDSRISIRGFRQEDLALMINGIPVNGMEDNKVYWSNWAGLSDVTRTIQVQRGLGASKLSVASVGGTINIITKSTDWEKGGNFFTGIGNNGYRKSGLTMSTGLMDNGWAFTVSASRITGDGYIEANYIDAWNYFVSAANQINDKNILLFTAFGAPQRHGQRDFAHNIGDQRNKYGIQWNDDSGTYQGETTSIRENYYHKPQISLSHIWEKSPQTSITTSAYVSIGRGGGTGDIGGLIRDDGRYREREFRQARDSYGHFQFDEVAAYNRGEDNQLYPNSSMAPLYYETRDGDSGTGQVAVNGVNGLIKRGSMNEHQWFGVISNINTELSDVLTFSGGIDLRWYTGSHYRKTIDLWGADYWFDDDNVNNKGDWVDLNSDGVRDANELGLLVRPKNNAADRLFGAEDDDRKIDYYNDENINWYGASAQLEYTENNLSAFISGGVNLTTMRRIDFFNKTPGNNTTDWLNFAGGNVKLGANYNIDDHHNIFVNTGFISRAPYFDALFPTFNNDEANEDAKNEQVGAFEFGYGYRGRGLKLNGNFYYTKWSDKTEVFTDRDDQGNLVIFNLLGVDARHMGVEIDGQLKVSHNLRLNGMASFGSWEWQNNPSATISDDSNNALGTVDLYLDGLKVGDAAQAMIGFGATYDVVEDVTLDASYLYHDNLYADFSPNDRDDISLAGVQALKLPNYGTVDMGLTWRLKMTSLPATFRINVNNLFDEEYIVYAVDRQRTSETSAQSIENTRGWFGFGRTWNASLKVFF
ncbi:MAG: TonB-dependent receptor [Bacteroidia bacterium]|nr:TonB-dependent receptor [Bacteroidia bacterium]